MVILGIVVCLFFAIYSFFNYKNKLNPLFVFSVLWAVILVFSVLRLYWLRQAEEWTYVIIAIGILFYGVGFIVSYKRIGYKGIKSYMQKSAVGILESYTVRYKVIYLLSFLTIALYLKDLSNIISHLSGGMILAYIRSLAQDSESILYEGRSSLESALRMLIIQPFVMAFQPIVAVEFWTGKKRRWKILLLDIVIVGLRMFTDGSRGMVMYLGVHLIITFIFLGNKQKDKIAALYNGRIKSSKKAKWLLYLLVAVFIIIFIISSMSRSGSRTLRNLYYNFSMEPYLMSVWLEEIKGYGFGTASLNGFVYPIIYVLKNFLRLDSYPGYWYEKIFLLINDTDQIWRVITEGRNTMANAYVSIFWFPYLDGGMIGEILIMFLLGFFSGYIFKRANKATTVKSVCMYSYFMQSVIMSFVRMQFASTTYALGFIFIIIFAYKKKHVLI